MVANPVRGLLDRKRSEEHLQSSNKSKIKIKIKIKIINKNITKRNKTETTKERNNNKIPKSMYEEHLCAVALKIIERGTQFFPLASYFLV